MKQTTDTDETLHNITKNHKIKILTVNKIDITLLQETHSTNTPEKQWQKK